MKKRKRILSLLLVCVLCFSMTEQAQASKISAAKKKAQVLQSKKKEAVAEKKKLLEQLESVLDEMETTKKKITAKEDEISKKEDELLIAQVDEDNQYEDMKKRIKYMYENGNAKFIEILCQSKSLSDFLNNAEYISTISSYDRTMLKKFQKVVKNVQAQEEVLKKENAELEKMQDNLIAKQSTVKQMLSDKKNEIAGIQKDIKKNASKLSALEQAAADAARKKQEAASSYSPGAGASVVSGNGTFTHPCPGYSRISSYFGYREQPLAGASTNHKGMDFAAPTGTPIYAAAGGTVVSAGYSGKAGNLIVINHGNGLSTYYMHCHKIYVRAGQKVSKGQNIAIVGTTGNSTGPHLHFQVMSGGVPVNPLKYL